MHDILARGADLVSPASFRGRLFVVATYPGAVRSRHAEDIVHGEVYRLRDPGLLSLLDRYEGCDPCDWQAPFARSLEYVMLAEGASANAWIYLYLRPTEGLERITSGDFLPVPPT